MARILIVDDDQEMLQLVKTALTREGHIVDIKNSSVTIEASMCRLYQLLLVDIMMPEEDGFTFVKRIRRDYDGPILFLTAKTEDASLVKGFGLGGDDYIKKPFSLSELRARVKAHLRRENRQVSHSFVRSGIRFDLGEMIAFVGDQEIPFTKSEYAIAEYLSEYPGQVYTKEQLYETVFGFDATGDSSAVAEHIKNIRAKLRVFHLAPIETVWGVGYKWQKTSAKLN